MPKPASGSQSDNARATGLRNFLKGEVITVDSDSDDGERMGTPAVKSLNLLTHQEVIPQVPEGVHPSRIGNHVGCEEDSGPTWREPKQEKLPVNWTPTGYNNIPLTVKPCYPLTSYGTGSNYNMPGPEANEPPEAIQATISRGRSPRKGRSGPVQGVKQPPTGPRVSTAPRKFKAEKRNHSMGHVARRRKYIAARKLLSRENDSNAVSTMNNDCPPSATQSAPPGIGKGKDSSPLLSSQLKNDPRNAFKNLVPTPGHVSKHSAVRPQYAIFRDSVTPDQDIAQWDKHVRVSPDPSSKVSEAADISLEQGHQVHPTRLNHFDPHYSTPSPEPDRYLSPFANPGRCDPTYAAGGTGPYKDGDIIGAGVDQIAATSKGRRMLEKMGYKPGVSLGRSGGRETELAVVTMKIGREGLGAGPRGQASGGAVAFTFSPNLPRRSSPVWAVNATSTEGQDENRSGLESSGYREIFGAKGIESKLEPNTTTQGNRHDGIGSLIGQGIKERVIIIIDSDDENDKEQEVGEEEKKHIQGVLPQEEQQKEQQGQHKDQKTEGPQDREVISESEPEYSPEDMEIGNSHDYMVHPNFYDTHSIQTSNQLLRQDPFTETAACLDTGGQPAEDVVDTSFSCDTPAPRWELPFRYSSDSCRPTVPMQLLGLVIIERLEQLALVEIFHCINAFEEDSYRLTNLAFNHVLAKSFLRVRDMFMRDPLLDVDQEICEGIVKEEFGALLEHLKTSSS